MGAIVGSTVSAPSSLILGTASFRVVDCEAEMSNQQPTSDTTNGALERDWIPLPNYSFNMPLPDSEAAFAEFAKLMFRMIALGVAEAHPKPSDEFQFVLLCRSFKEGNRTCFTAYAPFPQVVTFVRNHLPPKMESKALGQFLKDSQIEVRHSYAFPLDILLPMGIFYYPAANQVLFSNRNQYETPQQFLNPYSCQTTSGFLNFLGSFSLAAAKGDPASRKTFVVGKVDDPVGTGLKEWSRWLQHYIDCGLWETDRILISSKDPEHYLYNYSPNR
jgi:hypothetical protein